MVQNMAEHLWSVLCSNSSIDQKTNNISLFNVIEQLTLEGVPTDQRILVSGQFELVSLWRRSDTNTPEELSGRLLFRMPDGESLDALVFNIDLKSATRSRSVITMSNLPIKGIGTHYFIIEVNDVGSDEWKIVANLPLEVMITN
jgi:hypothetical protein